MYKWIKPESQSRHESDRTQHSYGVFDKAIVRVTDRANNAVAKVFYSAYVVDNLKCGNIVEECIDCKVPTKCIFFGRSECVVTANWPNSNPVAC